jgi:hypothetical protein
VDQAELHQAQEQAGQKMAVVQWFCPFSTGFERRSGEVKLNIN